MINKKENKDIDTLDMEKEIDNILYNAYGLNDYEIALVEGACE